MNKLDDARLNEIWRSGFCRATVRFAATTTDDTDGARDRAQFMRDHLQGEGGRVCADCAYAQRLKLIESGIAYKLGPETYQSFLKGGNITVHADFPRIFALTMKKLIEDGVVTEAMAEWMSTRAKRPDHGWKVDPT